MNENYQMDDTETLLIGGHSMTLRDVTQADMSEVVSLHQRVFGSSVDARWFAWKYGQGGGEGMGAWHEGRLVAHCGGLPRDLLHQGLLQHDLQIGDVMVDPEWRGILTRQGPFVRVSKALYESRLGKNNRFHTGFGFPNARALRLGLKSGLSWDVGQMIALQWNASSESTTKAGSSPSSSLWRVSRLSPQSAEFDSAIDNAWASMRTKTQDLLLGERHAAYVRWRFVMRPEQSSVFLQLRRPWQRKPAGVAVLSQVSAGQPWMQWLDWIGPPDLMAAACAMCRAEAAHAGSGLTAWASTAVFARLAQTGISAQSEASRISIAAASSFLHTEAAQSNWWFMGGDTDFL